MKKSQKVANGIKELISSMMDRVMNRVLTEDPFIVENHHANKPLYAALVPDEIFKGSHFERRFVTPFGKVWERLAVISAENGLGFAELNKTITGKISKERLRRISEVLRELEHPNSAGQKRTPNWDNELTYICEGKGELLPVTVVCDVFSENKNNGKKYSFELKSPLPNSDITKVSKEKLFKLYAMEPKIVDEAFFVLPYNPFGKKEDYSWSFPARWFNMKEDHVIMIGDEFWDFVGGKGTYSMFIQEINKLGKYYREKIYREYLGIEPKTSGEFML